MYCKLNASDTYMTSCKMFTLVIATFFFSYCLFHETRVFWCLNYLLRVFMIASHLYLARLCSWDICCIAQLMTSSKFTSLFQYFIDFLYFYDTLGGCCEFVMSLTCIQYYFILGIHVVLQTYIRLKHVHTYLLFISVLHIHVLRMRLICISFILCQTSRYIEVFCKCFICIYVFLFVIQKQSYMMIIYRSCRVVFCGIQFYMLQAAIVYINPATG